MIDQSKMQAGRELRRKQHDEAAATMGLAGLGPRACRAIEDAARYKDVDLLDLTCSFTKEQWLKTPNVGRQTVVEIEKWLTAKGRKFAD